MALNLEQFPNLPMKRLFSVLIFCLLAVLFNCKDDEPNYPSEPFISLNGVSFHKFEDDPDILSLRIYFRDGDKDVGLSQEDTNFPFNSTNFFIANNNSLTPIGRINYRQTYDDKNGIFLLFDNTPTGKLATLSTRMEKGFEFMPPYEFPYTCLNYLDSKSVFIAEEDVAVISNSSKITGEYIFDRKKYYNIEDTFYIQNNENFYNIFVECLYKETNDSEFKTLDWRTVTMVECGPGLDSRIPPTYNLTSSTVESGPFIIKMKSPYEGEIRYNMKSSGFSIVLGTQTIKLRIHIKDRALHDSNIIETHEFTLEEILQSE